MIWKIAARSILGTISRMARCKSGVGASKKLKTVRFPVFSPYNVVYICEYSCIPRLTNQVGQLLITFQRQQRGATIIHRCRKPDITIIKVLTPVLKMTVIITNQIIYNKHIPVVFNSLMSQKPIFQITHHFIQNGNSHFCGLPTCKEICRMSELHGVQFHPIIGEIVTSCQNNFSITILIRSQEGSLNCNFDTLMNMTASLFRKPIIHVWQLILQISDRIRKLYHIRSRSNCTFTLSF